MKRRTVNDPSVGRVSDSSGAIELASRGIGEVQASDLRSRLGAFAEDWNRPEMARYDDLPSCDAAQRETTGDGGMWEGELGQGKKGEMALVAGVDNFAAYAGCLAGEHSPTLEDIVRKERENRGHE